MSNSTTQTASTALQVQSFDQKCEAIPRIVAYAREHGCGEALRTRIQLVADELMMNALYHAPTDAGGLERFRHKSPSDLAREILDPISIQFTCDGTTFGLCVCDSFGSLTRDNLQAAIDKAAKAIGPSEDDELSGGMGIACALRTASNLVFIIAPARSTEVYAFFDVDARTRDTAMRCTIVVDPLKPEEIVIPFRKAKSTTPVQDVKKAVHSDAPQR